MKPMLDKLQEIRDTAKEQPGIGLLNLSKRVNLPLMCTRYRVLELAAQGKVRIEHGPRRLYVYPVTDNETNAVIEANPVASN
jgi:hypothetical protein